MIMPAVNFTDESFARLLNMYGALHQIHNMQWLKYGFAVILQIARSP